MNRRKLHTYNAFELIISSPLLLPELLSSNEVKEDIIIRLGNSNLIKSDINSDYSYSISSEKSWLHFSEVGTFFINTGCEIIIFPLPNVEEKVIRLPLLGAVLSVLLYQRDKYILHASSVSINGGAIIFVGNKGSGKSTMAASLSQRGHKLLADDTAAIEFDKKNNPIILSGFPQFKLYPDSILAATGDNPDYLPKLASNVNKRLRKAENFCEQSCFLKAIYVLEEDDKVSIDLLAPQEVLQSIMANSYMARFSNNWIENGVAAKTFQQCMIVVNQIPVYSLKRPRDLSFLEDVAGTVEKHALEYL